MKWALKIIAKLLLARLPIPYTYWKSIGVFRHGRMDSVDYPLKIFRLHMDRAYPHGLPPGAAILELGPGDSIASAIVGAAYGANQVCLVDVGNFANKDISFYKSLAAGLTKRGLNAPDLSNAASFGDVLQACNAQYVTNGIASLRQIPSATMDFAWSHSVLEHVRKHELTNVLLELRRILRPGAYSSHNIDFQDHLDGALNNLRFSESIWESAFFANSGFYTNRIPAVAMHDMFKTASFEILQERYGRWSTLPTARKIMHEDFQEYSDAELSIRTSHVLLRKP
jgi:SAM-dependent methyltransferase